ncbi:MAG: type II toxin-antitoxin system RelE/ParE family toxin [Candidatus Altiarchaeota archaeon]
MASHTPRFTSKFLRDTKKLKSSLRHQLEKAVLEIIEEPRHGKPLTQNLKGLWSKRVEHFRVIYEIRGKEILFYAFEHRSKVYKRL